MELQILNNREQFPTEEIIFSHIGKSKASWIALFDFIHKNYPDYLEEWRYYNDGKSWLLKVVKKKKTICWVSIIKNAFRMTFYFGDKAEEAILKSKLSKEYKKQFVGGNKYGKIRGITVILTSKKDLETAKILISIKESIK